MAMQWFYWSRAKLLTNETGMKHIVNRCIVFKYKLKLLKMYSKNISAPDSPRQPRVGSTFEYNIIKMIVYYFILFPYSSDTWPWFKSLQLCRYSFIPRCSIADIMVTMVTFFWSRLFCAEILYSISDLNYGVVQLPNDFRADCNQYEIVDCNFVTVKVKFDWILGEAELLKSFFTK